MAKIKEVSRKKFLKMLLDREIKRLLNIKDKE